MPSMIIRPLPDWNETLISGSSSQGFWRKIDAFWNETVDRMEMEQTLYGTEMDFDGIKRFQNCLAQFSQAEKELKEGNCPMVFDSWSCWNESQPGTIQEQPCPNFPHLGFSSNRPAFKVCTDQGHWWRHPDTNMTWSNYTQCVNIQDLQFRNTVNIISLSGWSISLFFMMASLFIFFYFRSLHCGRITMHKNLFLSMSSNNIFWILWYLCVLFQQEVLASNPLWCRALHVTKTYFMITTYSWMLCEGSYLQLLLSNTWGVKGWQLWALVSCGWGMPVVVMVPYTVFRALSEKENVNCWMDTGDSIWFLAVPVILAISFNVLIVINVIRLIKRKRNLASEDSQVAGGPNSAVSTLKAARAALMLIPILGIHFLLMPMRPEQGTILEYFYEVFAAISSSYQGFFVSIIFCFINNEVVEILKKKCCRRLNQGGLSYMDTATTRLPPPSPTPRRSIPTLRSSPFTKQQQRNRAGSLHDSTLLCVPNTMRPGTTRNGMGKFLLHNKRKSTTTNGSVATTASQETFQMLSNNLGDSVDCIEIQTVEEVVTQV